MKLITKHLWKIILVLVVITLGSYMYFQNNNTGAQQTQIAEQTTVINKELMEAQEQGKKFLAENGKREGVITTESGLQYEVLVAKTEGDSPVATSTVNVHYHGTTIDGQVFDSSVERGMPISFGLNQVIAGWTEGLQYMKVGEKFKFFIPEDIAYGDYSPSPAIPAGSTLIFEVELFEVN